MQFLALIGPDSLGLIYMPFPKPVTEARRICCSAWPDLGHRFILETGNEGISAIKVRWIETDVCVSVCMCRDNMWSMVLGSQRNSTVIPFVELHAFPWIWTLVGHGYLPILGFPVTASSSLRWGPPLQLGVFPRLCLPCLQFGPACPLPALNVPSKLHSACNVLSDTLATGESCIQRTIQRQNVVSSLRE